MDPCQDHSDAVVLVIDDEALIRQSIATYLEDSGFTVHQATDGPGGLEMIERHGPDVILLDLRMPGMDGLEVLARVTRQWDALPVIVVTGAGVLKDAIEAVRLGAFDFISKPIIDMAILEHAVCRAVERGRLQTENNRYRRHLETEVQARTTDLQARTAQLETANRQLETEMAERRHTEKALRQSQAQLSDVISVFEGLIYAVNAGYHLTFMNAKLLDHVRIREPEGICHQTIYGNPAPCDWCPLDQVLSGRTIRKELHSPEDRRWYHGIYSPQSDMDGKVNGCQAIVMDIHDRKTAEIHLRLEADRLQAHNLRLRQSLQGAVRFGDIIGKSDAMHGVYQTMLKAAESGANVIIYGESGTGKELVAQTIHQLSERGDKAFVPVNCGAIPDRLFESEFFGYKKGAFTGADSDKEGFLTAAQGGTLFLDEVGELPLATQVKLLRAIDGGGYTPLGSHQAVATDIRIIAATNRDLQHSISRGQFRRDFYYRLHVVPITLPALRDRREDIPLLIHHFLQIFSQPGQRLSMPEETIHAMQAYHWPGNVRELQNAVQQYMALQDVDVLANLAIPDDVAAPVADDTAVDDILAARPALNAAVKEFEKRYIQALLQENKWHRTRVASILGVDRRTLFRKINALGIK